MTTVTAPTLRFPSVEWFEALADAAARDEARYRRLGAVDMILGLWVGDEAYRLIFDGFGCSHVEEWEGAGAVDCVIGASFDDWRELVEHIRARGSADPEHTLNSLVLVGGRFSLSGPDQLGIDAFYRFNATLQALIEEAAGVPTHFQ